MKKYTKIAAVCMCAAIALGAQAASHKAAPAGWEVEDAQLQREGALMIAKFTFDMKRLHVPSEEALICTPVIYNGNDSIELNSIGVYGRNRYIHYLRRSPGMITGAGETVLKEAEKPDSIAFEQVVPYQPWMNGGRMKVRYRDYGCCFTIIDEGERPLARYLEPPRTLRPAYVTVVADSTVDFSLEGKAYVQFVVDKTDIRPDLFNNYAELKKITNSIDTVKSDPDFIITEVWLKGFASPESPYAHNTDLARGRTAAVKDYVQNLYKFEPGIITTDYEPEDWAGLREFVAESNIDHRQEILDLIDMPAEELPARYTRFTRSDHPMDKREDVIRSRYPQQYKYLKDFAYSPLRHTEYRVNYKVRKFFDVDEIKRVMKNEPQKLSLNDFNLAANTYEPGSPEFNEVYDIAVRVYPHSPVANLNAANSAMLMGNLDAASAYLEKAAGLPEAEYAKGLILLARGDIAGAKPIIEEAAAKGIAGAADTLQEINAYLDFLK